MKKLMTLSMGLFLLSMTSVARLGLAADPAPTTPTVPSSEQEFEMPMKLDKCTNDIKSFCSNVTPGKGRTLFCLRAHDDHISSTCKEQLQDVMKEIKELHQACKADILNFCKTVAPGEGRVMTCLKQHQTELSTECKALVK